MDTPAQRNRGRMILVGALALSLLGNALAAGAILRFRALKSDLMGPAEQTAVFPRPQRKRIRAAIADNADTLRPQLHALAAARTAVVIAGTADPVDRAALDAAMERFRAELDTAAAGIQVIIADTLTQAPGDR